MDLYISEFDWDEVNKGFGIVRPISARDMDRKERSFYERS